MAKYSKPSDRLEVERVTAGGGFDEDWIDIRRPTLQMFEHVLLTGGDDAKRMMMRLRMAHLMLADWSFVDDKGDKLPVTYEQLAGADDQMLKALEPLLERAADFLGRALSINQSATQSS